jgi:DNA-binding MarR family transcriptional regulator
MSADHETVRWLRKHPLSMKALNLLVSESVPMRLQQVAERLRVHNVSAHRTLKSLVNLKLIDAQQVPNARYRYFVIPDSKKGAIKRLISAAKEAKIPIGRGALSMYSSVEESLIKSLQIRDLVVRSAKFPEFIIRAAKSRVGLDLSNLSGRYSVNRFHETVGRIAVSSVSQSLDFLVIIFIVEAENRKLEEVARRLEPSFYRGFGIKLKFLWVHAQPFDLDEPTISKTIEEPILKTLDEWNVR